MQQILKYTQKAPYIISLCYAVFLSLNDHLIWSSIYLDWAFKYLEYLIEGFFIDIL